MTVAYAARAPYVGSRTRNHEPRQPWETVSSGGQGPIPWTLAVPAEEPVSEPDEPTPKRAPKPSRPKLSAEERSAINRASSMARWYGKEKATCKICGEPTVSNGRRYRKCRRGHYQRQDERPARLPWPPCPHCGEATSSNGFTRKGTRKRVLVCKACGKSCRIPIEAEAAPCL